MVAPALSPETTQPAKAWGDFLVLPENRSAARAARQIARSLARRKPSKHAFTGPLMLHGPPGTGKSALALALVHHVIDADPGRTARCVPAGELPRRAATADDDAGPDDFAEMLLCDLLIVEDLQHLPAKQAGALGRILDYRAARRRPTVLTSPVGPAALTALPRRLTSRLVSGLVVRLDPPGLASRKVLVAAFARAKGRPLADDACEWLAAHVQGTRPLIGAVEQLRGLSGGSRPLAADAVAKRLTATAAPDADGSPLDRIVNRVAAAYGVRPAEVVGVARHRGVMVPRQVAMYLARLLAQASLPRIGAHFGGRDHTTVLHALRKMEEALRADATLAGTVRELQAELE